MNSWNKYLENFKFIEWNEDNFDINCNLYVKQAYKAKKYAFVSDYVRLYALYHHGGIYLDTDVEVIKSLDSLLHHEAFTGFEDEFFLQSGTMGAMKGHQWIKEILETYDHRSFLRSDGTLDTTTNTAMITNHCSRLGLKLSGQFQVLNNGVVFYPRTYFSPYDYINGANFITDHSYTIHHFAKSWLPLNVRIRSEMKRWMSRTIGPKCIEKLRVVFNLLK